MPLVTMPDGTAVSLPDKIDPGMAARLRAFQGRNAAQPEEVSALEQIRRNTAPNPKKALGALRAVAHGIPFAGSFLDEADAATAAALAPIVPKSIGAKIGTDLPGKTFAERYNAALAAQRQANTAFAASNPVLSPAMEAVGGIAGLMAVPQALPTTLPGMIGLGAGLSAAHGFGAGEGGFAKRATLATREGALGAGLAGVLYPAMGAILSGANRVSDMALPLTKGGREKLLRRYQAKLLGETPIEDVTGALESAKEIVPGSLPTAGEAVSRIPGATGLAAHQQAVSKSTGISPLFSERIAGQAAARESAVSKIAQTPSKLEAAITRRDTITTPMRESAISAANEKGVSSPGLMAKVADMANKPGVRASDVVQKTLGDLREKIASVTNKKLKVDANDLYMIRKEAGNVVSKYAQEGQNFDKRFTSGLVKDVQGLIDDAIEKSGGTGWKNYLTKYSELSKPIDQMRTGQELVEKLKSPLGAETPGAFTRAVLKPEVAKTLTPEQLSTVESVAADIRRHFTFLKLSKGTDISGGATIAGQTEKIPQLLSRPAMITNYVLKTLGKDADAKINALAAKQYLDPKLLAESLRKLSPPQQQKIVQILLTASTIQANNR